MISLTIKRDPDIADDGFCYDIDFTADCKCGNQLNAVHPFHSQSVHYECNKCGCKFTFTEEG
jgi:hypothetical protein